MLVGGGSILIDAAKHLKGASKVIKPPHFEAGTVSSYEFIVSNFIHVADSFIFICEISLRNLSLLDV